MLANQSELMAFGKSGWHITEVTTDPATGNQTIYMGKCASYDGSATSASWCIKRTTITHSGNTQTIVEEYANGDMKYDNVWSNRTQLNYSYLK